MTLAAANASLSGGALTRNVTSPVAPPQPAIAIRYVCPAWATKLTTLPGPQPPLSMATELSVAGLAPVKTPRTESKSASHVSMRVGPVVGAVQRNQTVAPTPP